jgi:hypothetical protein
VSNLLPVFISKTLILREIQIKRALTSLFWYNVNRQTDIQKGDNAHEHYTLSSSIMPPALSAKLLVNQFYL